MQNRAWSRRPRTRRDAGSAAPAAPKPWNPVKAKGYLLMEAGRALAEGSTSHGEAWTKAHNSGAWETQEKFAQAFQAIGPAEHTLEFALAKIQG